MRATAEALRSIRLFHGLEESVLAELAEEMSTTLLQPGMWLAPPEGSSRRLSVVLAGALDVFATRDEGPVAQDVIPIGSSCGAWTLLGGGTRLGEVRATLGVTTTALGELDGEAFDAIADRHAGVRDVVLRNAIMELRDLELVRAIRSGWGIVNPEALASLAKVGVIRDIAAGEVLVRKGDPAKSAYLVLSGSFQVTEYSDDTLAATERAVPMLGTGQLVGERALLSDGVRSATLTAMRASRVAEFEAGAFLDMCRSHPDVLLRTVGAFMRRLDSRVRPEAPTGHRIALVGDGVADVNAFAKRLAALFPQPIAIIDAREAGAAVGLDDELSDAASDLNVRRLGAWLDRRTEQSPWLLLVADPRDRRWTAACLSHGDHVVALVEKSGTVPNRHPVWSADAPTLQPTTLVLLHPASTRLPSDTAGVLRQFPADTHLHVRVDRDADIGRVARMLAGVPYCLVLSGGGARGFAHLGAVRGMRELGIPCDVVGGTSIGAVMAAYQGMDLTMEEQLTQTEAAFKGVMDYTLPVVSLLKGRRSNERIQHQAGDHTIEDLWIPYFCISTNLSTNSMKIHDRGLIATAVRASLALPGLIPPVHDGEHFLIDGGVLNNFPLDVMRARHPFGKVIAIDVAAKILLEALGNFGLQLSGWRAALSMLRRQPLAPSIATTLVRTSMIGSARDRDRYLQMRYADLHIELDLKETGLLDFGGVRPIAEYGYQGSRPQLASWWEQFQGAG